jgi:hypothetical protein
MFAFDSYKFSKEQNIRYLSCIETLRTVGKQNVFLKKGAYFPSRGT